MLRQMMNSQMSPEQVPQRLRRQALMSVAALQLTHANCCGLHQRQQHHLL